MRVLICGDRGWCNDRISAQFATMRAYIYSLPLGTIVIEGEAKGADQLARNLALDRGLEVVRFPADWKQYGRAAGPIRNKQMLVEGKPDLVVAFHDNIEASKGTKNMLKQAQKAGIPTEVITSG